MAKYTRKITISFVAVLLASCAAEDLPGGKPAASGQNNFNNSQQYGEQDYQQGNGFGQGEGNTQRSSGGSDDYDYPIFLLRGQGDMEHKEGRVAVQRKLTYRIDADIQHTTLDVTMAVSGNYTRQVNESIINSGVGANVELYNTRAQESDFIRAENANSSFKAHKAYIYAKVLKKENTLKGTTDTWNAATPLPINVRPGARATYESLREAGGASYSTQISGAKSFTLSTRIEVLSLTDSQAILKMTNSVPGDSSGQYLDGFPLPSEQTVTVDLEKKEISKFQTRSFYLDGGRQYFTDMTYEICAFKQGGELTVYTLCNY